MQVAIFLFSNLAKFIPKILILPHSSANVLLNVNYLFLLMIFLRFQWTTLTILTIFFLIFDDLMRYTSGSYASDTRWNILLQQVFFFISLYQ